MTRRLSGAGIGIRPGALGRGIFALRPYRTDEAILRFRGRRVDRGDPLHAIAEGANLLQTGRRTYILPEPPGLFANHSCDPNAGIVRNRMLVAIRPIDVDEEIRFDYSTTMDEDGWTMVCACGASGCRGLISDFKTLPDDMRRRYLELGVVQGFIARRYRRH